MLSGNEKWFQFRKSQKKLFMTKEERTQTQMVPHNKYLFLSGASQEFFPAQSFLFVSFLEKSEKLMIS